MSPITPTHVDETTDTEITLGTGKMLALFFGLVILCAIFFGMGFSMGRNSVKSGPELLPSPTAPATNKRSAEASKPAEQPPASTSDSKPQTSQASPDASSTNSSGQPATSDQASPSPANGSGYFVQVAAVSKQEDAEALVESLKGRQYTAFIATPSPDKFFHVQIGPFSDIKEAESTRAKLVSDGYNPILKK